MIDFFSRLDSYMIFKGLNDNKITVETGISNGLIGKARKRGALSQDNISKILCRYTDLDANWLFTGKGSMLIEDLNVDIPVTTENIVAQLQDKIDLQNELIASLKQNIQDKEQTNILLKDKIKISDQDNNVANLRKEVKDLRVEIERESSVPKGAVDAPHRPKGSKLGEEIGK
jgi:hypothetical protein